MSFLYGYKLNTFTKCFNIGESLITNHLLKLSFHFRVKELVTVRMGNSDSLVSTQSHSIFLFIVIYISSTPVISLLGNDTNILN